ncbi:MAG TPA: hypothetical protein VJW75_04755 [Candidatus Eisenbacteria bacterium]|nr:hypothetical protein [Candidatus Eisenbacteria bacterium]
MRRLAVLLSMLPILAGCGDRSLILTVDVLSFLDPADVSGSYGPIPGGVSGVSVDVASEEVSLLPGIEDVTEVSSAKLEIGASFDNATGTADASFRIYITSADSADVFSSTPIADVPVSLTPGTVTNVATEVTSDALAEALVQDKVKIGIRITFDTTASGIVPVQGTETITLLRATVITKKNL